MSHLCLSAGKYLDSQQKSVGSKTKNSKQDIGIASLKIQEASLKIIYNFSIQLFLLVRIA